MESASIELKILSCKGLKAFNFFQKLTVYAVVSIVSGDPQRKLKQEQQQRTPTDGEGDGDPEWNHGMQFNLKKDVLEDCDNLLVQFDLKHEGGILFVDRTIGEVRVPLKDLLEESNGAVRFMSYEVRSTDGKPNGVLNFSFKVNGLRKFTESNSPGSHITGYPIVNPLSPKIQYPQIEDDTPSERIQYPSLELEVTSLNAYSYPANQEANYLPPATQESYNFHPPDSSGQPPPHMLQPPPLHMSQPPPLHIPPGPCYCSSPPQLYSWAPDRYLGSIHGYTYGSLGSVTGHEHVFDGKERWQNGRLDWGNHHLSSWSGR